MQYSYDRFGPVLGQRHSVAGTLAALLLACVLSSCGKTAAPATIPRGVVAVVGGHSIRESTVREYVVYAQAYYASVYGVHGQQSRATCAAATCRKLRRQALGRLIEERLVLDFAHARHTVLSHDQQAVIRAEIASLPTSDTTEAELVRQGTVTPAFVRTLLTTEALVRRVETDTVGSHAAAGPSFHLESFVIPVSTPANKSAAYAAALALASDGEPIPVGARRHIGWIAAFRLSRPVRSALTTAQKGDFVGPFTRSGGYLVLHLLGRGRHRYGKPARLATETRLFHRWLAAQLRTSATRCYDGQGHAASCPRLVD